APVADCAAHGNWTITNNMTGAWTACTYKSGSGSNDFDIAHVSFSNGPGVYCSSSTLKVTSSPVATDLTGVAYGGGLWVAVGANGKLARSPHGVTWTPATSSFGISNITAVAHADSSWVAVGASGKVATSTDGLTW